MYFERFRSSKYVFKHYSPSNKWASTGQFLGDSRPPRSRNIQKKDWPAEIFSPKSPNWFPSEIAIPSYPDPIFSCPVFCPLCSPGDATGNPALARFSPNLNETFLHNSPIYCRNWSDVSAQLHEPHLKSWRWLISARLSRRFFLRHFDKQIPEDTP